MRLQPVGVGWGPGPVAAAAGQARRVLPELDRHLTSHEVPTFSVDAKHPDHRYLEWRFRQPEVWREIAIGRKGMSNVAALDRRGGFPTATMSSMWSWTSSPNVVSRAIRELTGVSLRSNASSAKRAHRCAASRRKKVSLT